jgi:hypothetical protein
MAATLVFNAACEASRPATRRSTVSPSHEEGLSITVLRELCMRENARACVQLGLMFDNGTGGATRDQREAHAFYQRGCMLGQPTGCVNQGVIVASGNIAPTDWVKSAELYRQACEMSPDSGCGDIAFRHVRGLGVPVDHARALEYAQRGCGDGESPYACRVLANVYLAQGDHGRALEAFAHSCGLDSGEGCKELGDLQRRDGDVEAAARSYSKALPILEAKCFERDHPIACTLFSEIHDVHGSSNGNAELASKARKRACQISRRYCAESLQPNE